MQQTLRVSAVVAFLREVLEANEYFSDLWLVGEVSGFSRSQVGHRYFSLRDDGAALRSVLFRDSMPTLALKDGDRVIAHGRLTLYAQRGDLQFICDFVRPEGVGIMAARFEELRNRLEAEGLFDVSRKRPLPRFPRTIGVVTSPAGAALQDVKNVLSRRWPIATLLIAPAMVQGPEAPADIAAALRLLAAEPSLDLAIVARGGGSAEDLSAFNSEAVARAIYGFPVPLISGVGHETDITIADLVADLRVPTPSAAAERAVPDLADVRQGLATLERHGLAAAREALAHEAAIVDRAASRASRAAPDAATLVRSVNARETALGSLLSRSLLAGQNSVDATLGRIRALDPYATLARGYAIVQHAKNRKVVTSTRKVRAGDRLSVAVADGAFWSEVC